MLRFEATEIFRSDVLNARVGAYVIAEGVVVDEPDARENTTHLAVALDVLEENEGKKSFLTKAKKFLSSRNHIPNGIMETEYGWRVNLLFPRVLLLKPDASLIIRVFLRRMGFAMKWFAHIWKKIGEGDGGSVRSILFAVKSAFMSRIQSLLPEPHSSLLGGILLGAKESLGRAVLDDFRIVGLIHIVVLSGYNVTLVAEAIMRALSFSARVWNGVRRGSIVLFAILTGAGATVVRASTMALLVVLARATGRTYDITVALLPQGF